MSLGRCSSCGKFDWLDIHTCADAHMHTYEVWRRGENSDKHWRIPARSAHDAALVRCELQEGESPTQLYYVRDEAGEVHSIEVAA